MPSLEAQFSSISDDIAYNSHDLQDGIRAGLFNLKDLSDIPVISQIIYKHKKKFKNKDKELIINQVVRDIINEMVRDVVKNTKDKLKQQKPKTILDIHNAKSQFVEFSDKMKDFDQEIKSFLKENMYNNSVVLKKTKNGMKVVNTLFKIINKNPAKFIKKRNIYGSKERMVCDFIAGMTDRYALNIYRSIK